MYMQNKNGRIEDSTAPTTTLYGSNIIASGNDRTMKNNVLMYPRGKHGWT